MKKLWPRRRAAGAPRPVGPAGRLMQALRHEAELRTSVVLPQYTRPAPPTFVLIFGIVLAIGAYFYGVGFGLMAPVRAMQFIAPLAILAALTVWALPEMGTSPNRLLERFFFAFMITTPLWPNYLAISLPGLPWITLARLIGFPLVFLLAVAVSVSRTFRTQIFETLESIPSLWRMITAFAVILFLSVGLSSTAQFSMQKAIVYGVNWIVMFFAAVFVFRKPGRVHLFSVLMVAVGFILTAIAIREAQLGQILWANHIPSFLAIDDPSVQRMFATTVRAGTGIYRSQATYATPLGLGEILALTTPFVLHVIAGPGYRLWQRALSLLLMPFLFYGIMLTDTRLGVVGYILSIGIYILFWGLLQWKERPRSLIGPAVVLSYPATAAVFIVAVLTIPRLRVMTLGGGKHQASNNARMDQWGEGIPLVLSHPWGHGVAKGAAALGFRNQGGTLTIDTYWLNTALDYGVLGFITFYGAFVVAIFAGLQTVVRGVKSRELTLIIPLSIGLFVYFIIKSIYAGVENQAIAFMMLGALTALVWRAHVEQGSLPAKMKAKRKIRPM